MPIGRSSDPDRDRPHSSLPLSHSATGCFLAPFRDLLVPIASR